MKKGGNNVNMPNGIGIYNGSPNGTLHIGDVNNDNTKLIIQSKTNTKNEFIMRRVGNNTTNNVGFNYTNDGLFLTKYDGSTASVNSFLNYLMMEK